MAARSSALRRQLTFNQVSRTRIWTATTNRPPSPLSETPPNNNNGSTIQLWELFPLLILRFTNRFWELVAIMDSQNDKNSLHSSRYCSSSFSNSRCLLANLESEHRRVEVLRDQTCQVQMVLTEVLSSRSFSTLNNLLQVVLINSNYWWEEALAVHSNLLKAFFRWWRRERNLTILL